MTTEYIKGGEALVLASGSPRRRQLMERAGYQFRVVAPSESAETPIRDDETPREYVGRLARQKAEDVALKLAEGILLAADTVAECQGQILGKPENLCRAREMLTLLRGRLHQVHTGVCLWRLPAGPPVLRVESTTLTMDDISDSQLDQYLRSGDWQGKAGAFGYQDRLDWIHIVKGSESNVVGLPMETVAEMLRQVTAAD